MVITSFGLISQIRAQYDLFESHAKPALLSIDEIVLHRMAKNLLESALKKSEGAARSEEVMGTTIYTELILHQAYADLLVASTLIYQLTRHSWFNYYIDSALSLFM